MKAMGKVYNLFGDDITADTEKAEKKLKLKQRRQANAKKRKEDKIITENEINRLHQIAMGVANIFGEVPSEEERQNALKRIKELTNK